MPLIPNFDWTPKSVALSFTVGGNTYPYSTQADLVSRASDARYAAYTTSINTLLTFTSSVILVPGTSVVEYRWDFGDGEIGYGPTVTHTYQTAAPQTAAKLTVKDTLGQVASLSKILNLRVANRITVMGNTVVVTP